MAINLYDRVYKVTIGPANLPGQSWNNLDISFDATKTGDSSPNKLKLSMFNLNPTSRGLIQRKGNIVLLEAGYKDNSGLIFKGELELVSHIKEDTEWVSEIEAKDGLTQQRTVISLSFEDDTSQRSILQEAAKKVGVDVGKLQGIKEDFKWNKGSVLHGYFKEVMDTICKSFNLYWFILNGQLYVLPNDSAISQNAILLTSNTGMIGSPEVTEEGIKILSLLRYDLDPGKIIQIKSREIEGDYIARKIVHKGNTMGNDWYSEIEAIRRVG